MRSERHVATPDCHTLQRVNWARLFLFLPAIKIEIENSLEMALSEAKSSGAWQSHFWQCGTLRLLKMTHKMPSYISCLRAGSDLTSLCFGCGFGFVFVLCVFCSGLLCWFCFVVCFFVGTAHGLCIGPHQCSRGPLVCFLVFCFVFCFEPFSE